jgi:hypothetical protein
MAVRQGWVTRYATASSFFLLPLPVFQSVPLCSIHSLVLISSLRLVAARRRPPHRPSCRSRVCCPRRAPGRVRREVQLVQQALRTACTARLAVPHGCVAVEVELVDQLVRLRVDGGSEVVAEAAEQVAEARLLRRGGGERTTWREMEQVREVGRTRR